ncbi:hypothetical protein FQN55_001117 [Onygenales sp. PD_40]|nr:hypothetical protein FQN55_001117 [Onygenales sp. PD_40]KAK2790206.1 hypothetical protein FQN52_005701 [Onygenales sp. PD_12]
MFTLTKTLLETEESETHSQLTLDAATYLHDGKPYYFSEAFNLRVLAKKVYRDFYKGEMVRCDDNKTAIIIQGTEIYLQQLYNPIRKLVTTTQERLCDLIHANRSYLEQYSADGFINRPRENRLVTGTFSKIIK